MAEQWEYKSVLCNGGDDMEATLMPLGANGWEAVGFAPVVSDPSSYTITDKYHPDVIATVTQWSASTYRILLKRRKP